MRRVLDGKDDSNLLDPFYNHSPTFNISKQAVFSSPFPLKLILKAGACHAKSIYAGIKPAPCATLLLIRSVNIRAARFSELFV